MEELKLCPLCEGKIQIFSIPRSSHPFVSSKDKWYGQCKKCKWGIGRTRKANLIKALNRRPSPWIPITPETMPERAYEGCSQSHDFAVIRDGAWFKGYYDYNEDSWHIYGSHCRAAEKNITHYKKITLPIPPTPKGGE